MPHSIMKPLTWAAALLLVSPAGEGRAADRGPQASFAVEDGWVHVRVQQKERPVANARIRVFDDAEQAIAEGETDEDGKGAFPAPSNHLCRIGVTINGKECDLIPLHLHGTKADPPCVLMTFGTRPCCRALAASRRSKNAPSAAPADDPAPDRSSENWVVLSALAGGFCLTAGGGLFVLFQRRNRLRLSPCSPIPLSDPQEKP